MLTDKLRREVELLQRHILVLSAVSAKKPIGIMRLSEEIGLPPHKVRYSLRLLEHAGYIGPSTHGAVTLPPGEAFLARLPMELSEITEALTSVGGGLR